MRWQPRQWWAGRKAIVIGGGPSLAEFAWPRLRGRLTIGCNDAYALGPSVCTVCVFGDIKWWLVHRDRLAKWPNPIITNQPSLVLSSPDWVLALPRKPSGLHRDALGWGGNTGCVAVNVALLLGAVEVYLLGFDMSLGRGRRTNWHDQNVGNPTEASYARFQLGFQKIADDLPRVYPHRRVLTLGKNGLDMFPNVDIDKVLAA